MLKKEVQKVSELLLTNASENGKVKVWQKEEDQMPKTTTTPAETETQPKRNRRNTEQILAAVQDKIAYHSRLLETFQARERALQDRLAGVKVPRKGGGRTVSEETKALIAQFAALTPEELAERRRQAQREASALNRLLKGSAAPTEEEESEEA